jgi:drug/metabolite transporter (DMT)-like permease
MAAHDLMYDQSSVLIALVLLAAVLAANEVGYRVGRWRSTRDAILRRHVPEAVLVVLFGVLLIVAAVLGYAGGLDGNRPALATVAMFVLVVAVVFIIIDLDRPKRGFIQVSQESMRDVARLLDRDQPAAP